ncbi:hypothetical protein MARINOS108_11005 [Marinoscillum sp. 108]|nr:hypothetical protein MARINOS108_11005 [Marinoscillum sp. 108]
MIHTCPGRARLGCAALLYVSTFLNPKWISSVLQYITLETLLNDFIQF